MARNLVIFLHGVGGRGGDLAGLAQLWAKVLPDTDFANPDGPQVFDQGGPGRQWFSVAGVTTANRPARVLAAREAFDATINAIIAAHGLADQPERVALVGFSQGAIMALDLVASGRLPVAAVVAFSGRLASPEPLLPARDTKVFLVHGMDDPIMPAAESQHTADVMQGHGNVVEVVFRPHLGHSIDREGAGLAGAFLAKAFAEQPTV